MSLFVSCKKERPEVSEPDMPGTTAVSVQVDLPQGSLWKIEEMSVASLFAKQGLSNGAEAEITAFDVNGYETAFVTNADDDIVLLGYFNPGESKSITVNTESTAIALLLLNPWSMDLAPNAKQEYIALAKTLPEFAELKKRIEQSIASQSGGPLNDQHVLDQLAVTQRASLLKIQDMREAPAAMMARAASQTNSPLAFQIETSGIKVDNQLSSITYVVGLYDGSGKLIDKKEVSGLEKSYYFLKEFGLGKYINTAGSSAAFKTPSNDGSYTLVARNGFAFDGSVEDREALRANAVGLTFQVLGILSTGLKEYTKLINKEACTSQIGDLVLQFDNGTYKLAQSFERFGKGQIGKTALAFDVFRFVMDRYTSIVETIRICKPKAKQLINLEDAKYVGRLVKSAFVVSAVLDVFDTSAALTDWVQYDKKIEKCFQLKDRKITECNPLIGTWELISDRQYEIVYSGTGGYQMNPIAKQRISKLTFTADEVSSVWGGVSYTGKYIFKNNDILPDGISGYDDDAQEPGVRHFRYYPDEDIIWYEEVVTTFSSDGQLMAMHLYEASFRREP